MGVITEFNKWHLDLVFIEDYELGWIKCQEILFTLTNINILRCKHQGLFFDFRNGFNK